MYSFVASTSFVENVFSELAKKHLQNENEATLSQLNIEENRLEYAMKSFTFNDELFANIHNKCLKVCPTHVLKNKNYRL
mgnify:FL=1